MPGEIHCRRRNVCDGAASFSNHIWMKSRDYLLVVISKFCDSKEISNAFFAVCQHNGYRSESASIIGWSWSSSSSITNISFQTWSQHANKSQRVCCVLPKERWLENVRNVMCIWMTLWEPRLTLIQKVGATKNVVRALLKVWERFVVLHSNRNALATRSSVWKQKCWKVLFCFFFLC